jgi:glycine/D-amino acid oxidase-like deaminating enzyme
MNWNKPQKIAVVGGGLAGLSVLWHLVQHPFVQATLFDIGGGASTVSTGLLHPFPGKEALRSLRSEEGLQATKALLHIAQDALQKPVFEESGILRLAVTETQKKDFHLRSQEDSDAIWWDKAQVLDLLPLAAPAPGIFVPKGITVYSKRYLEGLWLACQKKGAKLEKQEIHSLSDLTDYDAIILTAGASTLRFEECKNLPLSLTKGQALICRWPERLPLSLVSQGHLTPTEDPHLCQIGSTYERQFFNSHPDPAKALELLHKASLFYPPAKDFKVEAIRSGIRIAPKIGYQPLTQKIHPNAWVFTGLGSRGLLYHALLGKEIVDEVLRKKGKDL